MWFACVSGVHFISLACQWTKAPAECWEWLCKAVQWDGERRFFLHVLEPSWPALNVPVGFAAALGRGPSLFLNSHCLLFSLLHLLLKSSFSAFRLAYIEEKIS